MNMRELRAIAKSHSISSGKLKKTELIQAIKLAEGEISDDSTLLDDALDQLMSIVWEDDECRTDLRF